MESHGAFIKPFFFPPFLLPLYKVPAVVMYKKSHCRHISVVFTSIFTIQTSKSLKYSKELKYGLSSPTLVQSTGKIQFHSTQKIFGNSHRNIWSNGKRPRKRFNFFLMSLRSCRYVAIMSLSEDVHTVHCKVLPTSIILSCHYVIMSPGLCRNVAKTSLSFTNN